MPIPEVIAPCEKICRRRAETPSKNADVFAPHRGGPRLSSDGFCSAEVFQQIEGIRAETRIPSGTSGPVSRVLSFKTAIYLDALLPTRSSRLPGTAGPAYVSLHGVAPDRVYSDGRFHTPSGELLPHLSTFAAPWRGGSLFLLHLSEGRPRRVLPVIPALWSPDFPHRRAFRPARAAVQPACALYHTGKPDGCQIKGPGSWELNFSGRYGNILTR